MDGFGIESWEEVQRLVKERVREGPTLEYKRELRLATRDERAETLKDLTGMGNGGGGAVLYGVEEDPAADGVPLDTAPLTDRSVVGRLIDIVRYGVRPPLVFTPRVLDDEAGGFALALEVVRSPLGPYMVEGYGDQRYYVRVGDHTYPMTEQQVRDAYALALRARERRRELWTAHRLPIRPETDGPWLTLSALPEEPLVEVFDPVTMPVEEFGRPDELALQAQIGGYYMTESSGNLRLWSGGIYGDDRYGEERAPSTVLRVHRDGAVGLGVALSQALPLHGIARAVNAQILYLAWLWKKLGVRNPVEVVVRAENLAEALVDEGWPGQERRVRQPPGVPVTAVALERAVLPWELARASIRHALVRDFADRLHHAFGYSSAALLFRVGWLYAQGGYPLGVSIGGRSIWGEDGQPRALVHDSGRVTNYWRNTKTIGYFVDGVVVDEEGRAMATVELAPGSGLPDDFVHNRVVDRARYAVATGGPAEPEPEREDVAVPDPVGEWSEHSLLDRLKPPLA